MTEKLVVKDLQKLDPGSKYVILYEIELPSGNYAYFSAYNDDDLTSVQFRDYSSPSTIRTYTPLPTFADKFEARADGPSARPNLTISTLPDKDGTYVFKNLLGNIDYDKLLGKKLVRRRTLKKYLYGESNDSNPPVEYPRQVFVIDRLATITSDTVTFELSSPFDITGVQIPKRTIIPNACPWIYQGASADKSPSNRNGACVWHAESKILRNGKLYTIYVNQDDYYIVSGHDVIDYDNYAAVSGATSILKDTYVRVTAPEGVGIYNSSGVPYYTNSSGSVTVTDGGSNYTFTVYAYFQSTRTATKTSLGTPSDSSSNWQRVFIYGEYSDHISNNYRILGSTVDNYCSVLQATVNSRKSVWKAVASQNIAQATGHSYTAPGFNDFWERADVCGKRLTSCAKRFGFKQRSGHSDTSGNKPSSSTDTTKTLPFGGFPGSKRYK